jgi:DNA polymerase
MEGFFTKKETQSYSIVNGKIHTCGTCGLYTRVNTPKMKPYGNFRKRIMNIGEVPGEIEDKVGKPWQGQAGQLLQKTYQKLGIDLFEDCININAVNCRTVTSSGKSRPPTGTEITCCRASLMRFIKQYKPHTIILFGYVAVQAVIAHRWQKDLGGFNKWRGWNIPDDDIHAWVCPVFHPKYVLHHDTPEIMKIWENDLRQAIGTNNIPLPTYTEPEICIIDDLTFLDTIKSGRVSIDYETTGLKPYQFSKNHRIVAMSVSPNENIAYSFLLPEKRKYLRPIKRLLMNKGVQKMAHNMKFEDVWSRVYLESPVRNWYWDSMLAAHILDNRSGITGLKFQTYVNFGVVDYSSEINRYLTAINKKDGNSINSIDELLTTKQGVKKLLTYVGLDTIYQYRLALKQIKQITELENDSNN